MTKNDIIAELATNGTVEEIVSSVTKRKNEDLSQDIYVWLLEADDKEIENLYASNTLNAYIIGMVRNNWFSKTSPYYKKYGKYNECRQTLEDEI